LVTPSGRQTRPTSDRVREAIFNALWSRGALDDDTTVLDLFAGSGAMGIEALSRGAAHATFVDDDAAARRAVSQNLATCGLAARATVVANKAERFLASVGGNSGPTHLTEYDLAFCDPPYAFDGWAQLLGRLPADLVVIEAAAEVAVPTGWEVVRSTTYGGTWVGFAEATGPPQGGAGET
jgi:16S rRNA (guanine966-N2)-methyltransferase